MAEAADQCDPVCAAKHSEPVMPEVLKVGEDNALADVFVTVVKGENGVSGVEGSYTPPAAPVIMDQNGCRYAPH